MSKATTTFEKLKNAGACTEGYRKLAKSLGGIRKYGKSTPITLLQVLESNGMDDTLWAMNNGNVEGGEKMAHSFTCDVAEHVLYIYEKHVPNDNRPRKAIEVKRLWIEGNASDEELSTAVDAAGDAAWDAAWDAARYAAWVASINAAGDAAWDAAWDAARYAASIAADGDAVCGWHEQRLRGYLEGSPDKYVQL